MELLLELLAIFLFFMFIGWFFEQLGKWMHPSSKYTRNGPFYGPDENEYYTYTLKNPKDKE